MYDEIIKFFKSMNLYNEEYFNKIKINTKVINKPYEEIKDFVGCFKTNNDFKLILPKLESIEDILIYIHEYTHCLFLDDDSEIIPNILEAFYVKKCVFDLKTRLEIIKKVEEEIKNSVSKKHIDGKKVKIYLIKI